jgi:PPOX class probable FMN-dependent enzyme
MKTSIIRLATDEALRQVYGQPSAGIRDKALPRMDGNVRAFIALSPFFCIGTGRPDALADVSPRGGEPGFVHVLDETTLAFPDRPGNNRLDTLTNLVHAPAVGLLFFVPGFEEMLRINGVASITIDEDLMQRFIQDGKRPRSVIVVETREVYLHCTKALKRAELWNPAKHVPRSALPSFGQMLREQYRIPLPAAVLDFGLRRDAKRNLY